MIEIWHEHVQKELLAATKDGVVADLKALEVQQELWSYVAMDFIVLFNFSVPDTELKRNSLQGNLLE